jgi:hypothetical protein
VTVRQNRTMSTFAVLPLVIRTVEDSRTGIGPGLLAFAIVVLLALATFLLIRSMLHHVKKVPPSFETQEPSDPVDPSDRDVSQ